MTRLTRSVGLSLVVASALLAGCRSSPPTKDAIIGTWERAYQGSVVQEITFADDGSYTTDNPRDPGRPEVGRYEVAPDGQTIQFTSRRGVVYTWHMRFRGPDKFDCWEEIDGQKRFEFTFTRNA
jgi:hypothetical protein